MDDATRREIDEVCWKTLKEAGIVRPPVRIENVLEHLNLRLDFYDLQDPGFLDRISYKTNIDEAAGGHRNKRTILRQLPARRSPGHYEMTSRAK